MLRDAAGRPGDGVPALREDIVTILSSGYTFAYRSHRAMYL
ncbi:hypothetical protein ACFU8W_46840 [Streptomyces sp. NPDC057565]